MKLSEFDFDLPTELIAQRPVFPRNHARLLVYNRRDKSIIDEHFYNLDKYLPAQTALVLNNSKVEKCRLVMGSVEVFVLEEINSNTITALVRPGKKFREGDVFTYEELEFKTLEVNEDGSRKIKLNLPLDSEEFDDYRLTPLPPYIKQDESLADEYQTVYAEPLGSKASPTAGLHFTDDQLEKLAKKHEIVELTLHVGLGTFGKLTEEQIKSGRLHSEKIVLSEKAEQKLNNSKHITAVGTTSARVLETVGRPFHHIQGSTDIFIKPGYEFKAVDALITNFHLPKTSLLMLVAAFMGSTDEMQKVYEHAIKNKYRFYSFGDGMLIL